MSSQATASGYGGSGSQLTVVDKVIPAINMAYYCQSPLSSLANWNADPEGELKCGGAMRYETSLGLEADEVCGDLNGNVTHLHQSFSNDKLILCGEEIFTFKRNHVDAARLCNRLNELDNVFFKDLEDRTNQLTVPFALMKLIGSADASGKGLGAIGIPATSGVAAGLGDLNNPIKIDVSSSREGGNLLQTGALDMKTLVNRLKLNMFAKGVTCSTKNLSISGGGGLEGGLSADEMCLLDGDNCRLVQTGMNYTITNWMPYATNAAGQRVDYIVMHDPMDFWFQMHTLYMKWHEYTHHSELGGAFLWGAKVNRPKSVSVAAVQFV